MGYDACEGSEIYIYVVPGGGHSTFVIILLEPIYNLIRKMFERRRSIVLCGFPGIGKSYVKSMEDQESMRVCDLDYSEYRKGSSWEHEGQWPENYITAICDRMAHFDVVLVSSHYVVREALMRNGVEYVLVYPDMSCKAEYLDRYRNCGLSERFLWMARHWDADVRSCERQDCQASLVLPPGQYLSDVMWLILEQVGGSICG